MKTITSAALIFICNMLNVNAQKNLAGEYYLQGVMETASGFKLNTDSSFEFFFSYGALDRYGSGKWSVNKDSIILISKQYPGKDFKLINTVPAKNNLSVLKIEDPNTNLYRLVYCRFKSINVDTIINFNEDGTLVIPFAVDSVELLSELCAERASSFAMNANPSIYTFNFEPWIVEVFFNNNALHYLSDYLEGRHPLLDDKTYRFYKQK
jgi:hypothetical protein